MSPKYKKWLFLAIVALIPILGGCDGCDKKKYVAPPPAPSAPSNLTGSAVSSTEIDLSWQDNSTNEKGFYLYRRTTNSYARVAILEENANSYNDTGLSSETTYSYKVKAYNDGGESGSSNEVSVTTLAGSEPEPEPEPEPELQAPSNLAAMAGFTCVTLQWDDNSSNEDGFRVYCDDGQGYEKVATLERDYQVYSHDPVQPMTEYTYYVEAYRGEERAKSEEVSCATGCPVIILRHWLSWPEGGGDILHGDLENFAVESVRAEVTANFYMGTIGEWIATRKVNVQMEPMSQKSFEMFLYFFFVRYTVEITDVKLAS